MTINTGALSCPSSVSISRQRKDGQPSQTIGEIVYKAMTETINVPEDDKFQVMTEHEPDDLNFTESYLGIAYSKDIDFIQITLNAGRTIDMKKAYYRRIVDDPHEHLKIRREDVVINLVEVAKENWSFGNGIAQYG